jgi:hypothetical protein
VSSKGNASDRRTPHSEKREVNCHRYHAFFQQLRRPEMNLGMALGMLFLLRGFPRDSSAKRECCRSV